MGKDPAEIEREIATRRAEITARIQGVQDRVREDVQSIRDTAQEQASEAIQQTKSKVDISNQTREHPYSMLAGALGLGVMLGAASEGLGGGGQRRDGSQRNDFSTSNSDGGGAAGALGGLMASMFGPASQTMKDELQELVKEGFSTLRSNMGTTQNRSKAGSAPPEQPYVAGRSGTPGFEHDLA